MEGVAAASSIVSLIDFSGKILAAGYGFLAKVARAPAEVRMLLSEVAKIDTLLAQIQSLAIDTANPSTRTALQSLTLLGTFDTCETLLKAAEQCLDSCRQTDHQQFKNFSRALRWPLTEREMKDTMQQLRDLQNQLTAAMTVDSVAALRRLETSTFDISARMITVQAATDTLLSQEKSRELMPWLSPDDIDPDEDYETALQVRHFATGRWFLESPVFQKFLEGGSGLFWLYGSPGIGKTILSTTIIQYAKANLISLKTGLVYFYCDHRNPQKQSSRTFLSSFAMQTIRQQPACLKELETIRQAGKGKARDSDLLKLVKAILRHFLRVVIVLDALDESTEEEKLAGTFAELLRLAKEGHTTVQLFVSSREDLRIERVLSPITTSRMSLAYKMNDDIRSFIAAEVDDRLRSGKLKLRNDDLRAEILESLLGGAGGLFLQAKIQLDYLSSFKSDRAIRRALANLPRGLDKTYEQVLESILARNAEQAEQVRLILCWLVFAYELLTTTHLAYAISIQPEDTRLDLDNIATDPEDLVALCGSLVTIDRSDTGVYVNLAHFSLEEYLRSDHIAEGPAAFFHARSTAGHLLLARTCLQYVSFKCFDVPGGVNEVFFTLGRYAAISWPKHLRDSGTSDEHFECLVLPTMRWFLEPETSPNQYRTWEFALSYYHSFPHFSTHQPPLYYAISFGVVHVVRLLLSREPRRIDVLFDDGWTPLTLAIVSERSEVALHLLNAGASPGLAADGTSHNALTPLHIAAERAQESIVEQLLKRGAPHNALTRSGTTPFYRAARGGSLRILHMLHDLGTDVNSRTWDGWRPLFEAIERNHPEVVKQLLKWGADCRLTNTNGNNAIGIARLSPYPPILQILLDHRGNYALPYRLNSGGDAEQR